MRIVREKIDQLLLIGKVIGALQLLAGRANGGAWVIVGFGRFQSMRVKNLEGDAFLDQVDYEVVGVAIPTLPLYLEEGKGIPNEKLPVHISFRLYGDKIFLEI